MATIGSVLKQWNSLSEEDQLEVFKTMWHFMVDKHIVYRPEPITNRDLDELRKQFGIRL